MTNTLVSTIFPLGAYLGNPDNSAAGKEALFESYNSSFTKIMGAAPQFLVSYVDYSKPISQWVGNSAWAASSFAASANAKMTTPVIGLPMASNAAGSMTSDQQFQAFASGQYDSVIKGIVQSWAAAGFKNLIFRPGWEMNLTGPTYAGSDAASQADWVKAFQHIYTALHQDAAAASVGMQVVWNPGVTNYSNAEAVADLYPGSSYVDVIGADAYSDIHPYSDGGTTPTYHDWDTGKEDTSIAQFIADPINRAHYWTSPAATKWSSDGSNGHSQSLDSLIAFAKQQGKPFAIPETGAGNSNAGTDVSDDAAYPQWLAQQLATAQAGGEKISFVNIWDSNGGGNYEFTSAADNKPLEAAAWAKYFGAAPVVTTPAPAALTFHLSEDAWKGDARYSIAVDGKSLVTNATVTALKCLGQSQAISLKDVLAVGTHSVAVSFLNDAWGGTRTTDRNLYLTGIDLNSKAVAGTAASLMSTGTDHFQIVIPTSATGV